MSEFKFWCWMKRLGERLEQRFPGQCNGWEGWDDWREYFNDGFTPREAIAESHRCD